MKASGLPGSHSQAAAKNASRPGGTGLRRRLSKIFHWLISGRLLRTKPRGRRHAPGRASAGAAGRRAPSGAGGGRGRARWPDSRRSARRRKPARCGRTGPRKVVREQRVLRHPASRRWRRRRRRRRGPLPAIAAGRKKILVGVGAPPVVDGIDPGVAGIRPGEKRAGGARQVDLLPAAAGCRNPRPPGGVWYRAAAY